MIPLRNSLICLCVATATVGVLAQTADEHKAHHPEGAAAPVAPVVEEKKAPGQSMGAERMAAMDQRMKDMQAMHEKMMSAKTPEERQALMAEHMKMMQDGMAMMKQMGGMSKMGGMQGGKGMSGMSERHQMMEKRMEMMESMMQMMMDRMQSPMAPAAK